MNNKNKFKIGDVLKIKSNTVTPEKLNIGDRVGRVINIHKKGKIIEFEWDSETLKNINQFELKNTYIKNDIFPYYMYIPVDDFELAEARDTIEELEAVQDIIEKKVLKIEKKKEDKNDFRYYTEKWLRRFYHSPLFKDLTYFQQDSLEFIIETFSEYMHSYHNQLPNEWTIDALKDVCLNLVPKRITADNDIFKNYGTVLLAFFKFLEEREYLNNKGFQECIKFIDKDIYKNSKKSENWGFAKLFSMFAIDKGYDIDDQEQMKKAVEDYNKKKK